MDIQNEKFEGSAGEEFAIGALLDNLAAAFKNGWRFDVERTDTFGISAVATHGEANIRITRIYDRPKSKLKEVA